MYIQLAANQCRTPSLFLTRQVGSPRPTASAGAQPTMARERRQELSAPARRASIPAQPEPHELASAGQLLADASVVASDVVASQSAVGSAALSPSVHWRHPAVVRTELQSAANRCTAPSLSRTKHADRPKPTLPDGMQPTPVTGSRQLAPIRTRCPMAVSQLLGQEAAVPGQPSLTPAGEVPVRPDDEQAARSRPNNPKRRIGMFPST